LPDALDCLVGYIEKVFKKKVPAVQKP